MKLKFIEKIKESNDTYSFIFKAGEKVKWEPGQYIFLKIPHKDPDSRGTERHFTISSAPFEDEIRLTTKFDFEQGSSYKKALFALLPDTTADAFGVSGEFVIKAPEKKYVFIAGGIGITPCRSIFIDLAHKGMKPDITLIYGNKSEDIPFKDIIDKLAEENDWLDVNYIIEPQLIDEKVIRQNVSDLSGSEYYLSGPPKMIKSIGKILIDIGIPEHNIIQDLFTGYDD